jgi:hypothetical protein
LDGKILESVIASLSDAGVEVTEVSTDLPADASSDARLRLSLGDRSYSYDLEVKAKVSAASIYRKQLQPGRRLLLVAPHISDRVGDSLREQGVHYVDSAGNMFLKDDGLLLDVRGRRGPTTRPGVSGQPLRAFKASGLKVVFALLADPDLVAAPFRDIARVGGVSLGTVHWVLSELETAGYVTTDPRRLHRTRHLLDRWVEAYTFNLWPRLTLAVFDAADPRWWQNADESIRSGGAQWGGETAAHMSNPRLQPRRAVIYAPEVPKTLAMEFRFRRAEGEGGVEIRRRFWSFGSDHSLTVPAPLTYGDLIASDDPRLAEAAADLRENDALLQRLDRG